MGSASGNRDFTTFSEAARAVRARHPGRDPAAVRAVLEEELAKRGVTDPDPRSVESWTRSLALVEGPLGPLRLVRQLWHDVGELRVLLKNKQVPEWLKPPTGHEVGMRTREVEGGTAEVIETADVDLTDAIQPFLAEAFEASYDPKRDNEEESQCKVWIDTRRLPPAGASLPVILGQEVIGSLDGEDAIALEQDLRQAEKRKQPLILESTIERKRHRFSVWVIVPPTDSAPPG